MKPATSGTLLLPESEAQGFVIALAETGDPPLAEQLVTATLQTLAETSPDQPKEVTPRFFRLLISLLIDWRWQQRSHVAALLRLSGPLPFQRRSAAPYATAPALLALPAQSRHRFLLTKLTPLSASDIEEILSASPPGEIASGSFEVDSRLDLELQALTEHLDPQRRRRLRQARAFPELAAEYRVMNHWWRALRAQTLPTGLAMLVVIATWLFLTLLLK